MTFSEELKQKTAHVEEVITGFLPEGDGFNDTVIKAMKYSFMAGGKRLRPMLMEECYHMFGGSGDAVQPFMAAIEMIHTYSLIHDDLPALDNDDLRRGRPTNHKVYGEAMAILAGDALLNYAYETAAGAFDSECNIKYAAAAMKILASKPGISGMLGGQVADVELTGSRLSEEQLHYIYENKTGALIEASMMIGTVLAGAEERYVDIMEQIASAVGIAFQIQDDILDVVGDTEVIGKPAHSDMDNGKITYVTIHGLDKAAEDVKKISEHAVELLDSLPYENKFLRELILSLISRNK